MNGETIHLLCNARSAGSGTHQHSIRIRSHQSRAASRRPFTPRSESACSSRSSTKPNRALLQPDGRALLYRGQWSAADQGDSEAALTPLRARIVKCLAGELPAGRGSRHDLVVQPLGAPSTPPARKARSLTTPSGG